MTSRLNDRTLQTLESAVQHALAQQQSLSVVVTTFRAQTALLDRLPPAFRPALEGILERVEAGALFTEESCSFSQGDLAAALQVWLEKADARLNPPA